MRVRTFLVFAVLILLVGSARAFFDPPQIVPAAPIAGEVVSVQIRGGICDTFTDAPNATDITRDGANVRIVIDGIHSDDPIFCLDPIFTVVYPVGAFAPGAYTLTVVHRYQNIAGQFIESPIGTAGFSVGATAIPATTSIGLLILGVFVVVVGLWGSRRHGVRDT